MKKMNLLMRPFITALMIVLATLVAQAFSPSYYAPNSKLATGKWVKVKVKNTGITQITPEELVKFGFNDPAKVRIFGYGGEMLLEQLTTNMYDDLTQVPLLRKNGKIYFYAKAGRQIIINSILSKTPKFLPIINPYSDEGYYFITDKEYDDLIITKVVKDNNGTAIRDTGLEYSYHESEEVNIGSTGKIFLGEDITSTLNIDLEMSMPAISDKFPIVVNPVLAMAGDDIGYITTSINGKPVEFNINTNIIRPITSQYTYFASGSPYVYFSPESYMEKNVVNLGITGGGLIKMAKVDFLMLTYTRNFTLNNSQNQARINIKDLAPTDKVIVTDNNKNIELLDITLSDKPNQYALEYTDLPNGTVAASCTPSKSGQWVPMIAFNTEREQYNVEFVEQIPNQDLHSMAVPDMLIITTSTLVPYAQKIADLHKKTENLDVVVIEDHIIFNEFSSGTPDATAYRRFAKMLWDKNPNKFRNLLFFGTGSFDNRDVKGKRGNNRLLTYQSDKSNDETESFTSDDYFAILEDNSGLSLTSEKMNIGIGRIPVATVQEAENAVKKLSDYIYNSSHKSWRNSALIISDAGEENLFAYQAEGIQKLLNDTLNIPIHLKKVYADAFPLNKSKYAEAANAKTKKLFEDGQLIATYIGHGGPNFLTKGIKLWGKEDVKKTKMANIPLFTLATCDVARFDSDIRGIAELMFHQPNGGAIACMASSRTVYATENDILNRAFLRNLLTPLEDGSSKRIGEAFMDAKRSFARSSQNKLNFILLGDPAMKLSYPKARVKINTVNDVEPGVATINPLSKFTVSGEITKIDGTKISNFNGNVIVNLYDAKTKFADLKYNSTDPVRTSYIENDILAFTEAKVVNGEFSISCLTPRECKAQNEVITMSFYAYDSNTNEEANGILSSVKLSTFNASNSINDTKAPIIKSMYLNSQGEGEEVTGTPSLFVEIEDDNAINQQSPSIGNALILSLDGKNSINTAQSHITYGPDSKTAILEMPIEGLTEGKHSLELHVSDIANNRSTKRISFFYSQPAPVVELTANPSIDRKKVTFNFNHEIKGETPEVTINVVDSENKLIWQQKATLFPIEWNIKDIKPGCYSFYGSVASYTQRVVTPTKKIVLLKQ